MFARSTSTAHRRGAGIIPPRVHALDTNDEIAARVDACARAVPSSDANDALALFGRALEHSPALKQRVLKLEREFTNEGRRTYDALADALESVSDADVGCAHKTRALATCVTTGSGEGADAMREAMEALSSERERLANFTRNALASENVRRATEKDVGELRERRKAVDAAKKEYDGVRQRYMKTTGGEEELRAAKLSFERARRDLLVALQRVNVAKHTRTKRCAVDLIDAQLDYFRRGVEILTRLSPTLDILRKDVAAAEAEGADLEAALNEEMEKLMARCDDEAQSTSDALSMVSDRAREMSAQMASSAAGYGSSQNEALMQGYLLKRSSGKIQDWKRRFFVLDARGSLTYTKSLSSNPRKALGGKLLSLGSMRNKSSNAPSTQTTGGGEVRETVSLLTATIKPDLDDDSNARFAFRIVSPEKTYYLRCESNAERSKWMEAITTAIASLLNSSVNETILAEHEASVNKYGSKHSRTMSSISSVSAYDGPPPLTVLVAVPGNGFCADCDMPEPDWASLNLGIMLCLQCSGVHRQLGVQVSKVRSATLDVRAWEPSVLEFFSRWGNAQSNARWEYEKAEVEAKKPNKNSSLESRKAFILSKYVAKAFCRREAQPTESQLLTAINSNSLPAVMDLLLKGPHIKMHWVMLTAACDCGDASIAILEALLHHNVDVNARENPYTEDTALHYAARRGRDAFAKVLLRRGADPRVLNGRGQTAFDVAVDIHGAIRDEDLLIMLSAAQDDD